MPVHAVRLVRKMRGGAQSHLIQADDGHYYVVKFRNNPQHRRILVNELVASVFLGYLRIASPRWQLVRLSAGFLKDNPEVCIQLGSRRVEVPEGWHFGSAYPGDPSKLAVYDFLPDALLRKVENLRDFLGILVFDQWVSNSDARQAVFFRARIKDWLALEKNSPRVGFVTLMIDHGYAFNGPNWDFPDSPLQGFYFRPLVYEQVRSLEDFEPWLSQVRDFPETLADEAYRCVPEEWLEGDRDTLAAFLEKLLRRRRRIDDLMAACRRARAAFFPNWR